jgi:SnoaL-like protein
VKNAAAKRPPIPQQQLTANDVKHFLVNYKKAWETRDPDLAAGLFTRDAQYKQDPFGSAVVGREAIHDYWAGATGRQDDTESRCGISASTGTLGGSEMMKKRLLHGFGLAFLLASPLWITCRIRRTTSISP